MLDIIRGGEPLRQALAAELDKIRNDDRVARIPAADVRWYPPVRNPGKICAVAMNNSSSNERKISAPDHPAFFLKPPSCLVGHREPIRIRPVLRQRAPRARARRRHRPRDARRASHERARRRLRLHDLQRHHRQRHARRRPVPLLGRVREEGRPDANGARRAAPVVRGPLQGHGHVRRAWARGS